MLIKQVSAMSHDICTYTIRLYDNGVIFSNSLLYIPRLASLLCIRGDRFVEAIFDICLLYMNLSEDLVKNYYIATLK